MSLLGCPDDVIRMVRQFHDGIMVRVLGDRDPSDAFPLTSAVKQGYSLAPTMFSMTLTAMLTDAFHDSEEGIKIRYRMDGRLFNHRRLQFLTKVKETVLKEFLFAGDCALNAGSEPQK